MSCTREIRESRQGKFEGSGTLGEALYEMDPDMEIGSVQEEGWYGLILDTGLACAPHVIVREDNQGFFDIVGVFLLEEKARQVWDTYEKEYGKEEEEWLQ